MHRERERETDKEAGSRPLDDEYRLMCSSGRNCKSWAICESRGVRSRREETWQRHQDKGGSWQGTEEWLHLHFHFQIQIQSAERILPLMVFRSSFSRTLLCNRMTESGKQNSVPASLQGRNQRFGSTRIYNPDLCPMQCNPQVQQGNPNAAGHFDWFQFQFLHFLR